jgi:hypothetical protein
VRRRVRDRSGVELIWEIKRIGLPAAAARPGVLPGVRQSDDEERA